MKLGARQDHAAVNFSHPLSLRSKGWGTRPRQVNLLQEFASLYGLKLASSSHDFPLDGDEKAALAYAGLEFARFGDEPSVSNGEPWGILGQSGFVIESHISGHLQAGIVYSSTRERMKKEFKLSYCHCRVLEEKLPNSSRFRSEWCFDVLFDPSNERQAKIVIELAGLK